jgi:hypothetical protein
MMVSFNVEWSGVADEKLSRHNIEGFILSTIDDLNLRLWSGVWDNLTPNRALFNAQLGSHQN